MDEEELMSLISLLEEYKRHSSEATKDIRSLQERVEELDSENALLNGVINDEDRVGMIKELEESVLHMDELLNQSRHQSLQKDMRITDLEGEVRRHVLREKSLVNADVSELMFLRTERDRLLVLTKAQKEQLSHFEGLTDAQQTEIFDIRYELHSNSNPGSAQKAPKSPLEQGQGGKGSSSSKPLKPSGKPNSTINMSNMNMPTTSPPSVAAEVVGVAAAPLGLFNLTNPINHTETVLTGLAADIDLQSIELLKLSPNKVKTKDKGSNKDKNLYNNKDKVKVERERHAKAEHADQADADEVKEFQELHDSPSPSPNAKARWAKIRTTEDLDHELSDEADDLKGLSMGNRGGYNVVVEEESALLVKDLEFNDSSPRSVDSRNSDSPIVRTHVSQSSTNKLSQSPRLSQSRLPPPPPLKSGGNENELQEGDGSANSDLSDVRRKYREQRRMRNQQREHSSSPITSSYHTQRAEGKEEESFDANSNSKSNSHGGRSSYVSGNGSGGVGGGIYDSPAKEDQEESDSSPSSPSPNQTRSRLRQAYRERGQKEKGYAANANGNGGDNRTGEEDINVDAEDEAYAKHYHSNKYGRNRDLLDSSSQSQSQAEGHERDHERQEREFRPRNF